MWQEKNDTLYKKFEFKDFVEAFAFITEVAALAEEQNHHPKWTNRWNEVEIWLSTHDAEDKVTDKDKKLASAIDNIQKRPSGNLLEAKLFTDGGSRGNPGPSASGYVILGMDDQVVCSKGVYLGVTTNNQAEYKALMFGMEEAKSRGIKTLHVFLDSQLVVNQLNGVYKQKNVDLRPIYAAIMELKNGFVKVVFTHVPRELNKLADAEVNKALDVYSTYAKLPHPQAD